MSWYRFRDGLAGVLCVLSSVGSACAMAPLPLSHSSKVEAAASQTTASESGEPEAPHPEEYRITCKYEMANCERRARKECSGAYDVLERANASCADCGLSPSDLTSSNDSAGTPVYQGRLRVRCR